MADSLLGSQSLVAPDGVTFVIDAPLPCSLAGCRSTMRDWPLSDLALPEIIGRDGNPTRWPISRPYWAALFRVGRLGRRIVSSRQARETILRSNETIDLRAKPFFPPAQSLRNARLLARSN